MSFFFFFFNDTATTEIYTLSLHDALPISERSWMVIANFDSRFQTLRRLLECNPIAALHCKLIAVQLRLVSHDHPVIGSVEDRKSTRLNSSHSQISYAVFCLKKKKKHNSID